MPRHTRVFDVGAFRGQDFVSLRGTGEFYLLTEYAEGAPMPTICGDCRDSAACVPRTRAAGLVGSLPGQHPRDQAAGRQLYTRSIRDLVGSGEGIFGIVDGYPGARGRASTGSSSSGSNPCASVGAHASSVVTTRLVRIHGDFHPFNVLFDERSELHLLDASRGSAGDAADDVSAMAMNFLFFALDKARTAGRRPFSRCGDGSGPNTWSSREIPGCSRSSRLSSLACLVFANPVWYPHVPARASRLRASSKRVRQPRSPERATIFGKRPGTRIFGKSIGTARARREVDCPVRAKTKMVQTRFWKRRLIPRQRTTNTEQSA